MATSEPKPQPDPVDMAVIQTAIQLARDIDTTIRLLTDNIPNEMQAAEIASSVAVIVSRANSLIKKIQGHCLSRCLPL